jgi:hypothetical protein
MALFFNLQVLEREAAGDSDKLIQLLRYHRYGSLPSNSRVKYKPPKSSLNGNSFILNPDPVLKYSTCDSVYISQYIKLCGKRDYFMYKTHKVAYLDRSYFPDLAIENIKNNPLLIIEPKLIKFKYEEIYNGKEIRRN